MEQRRGERSNPGLTATQSTAASEAIESKTTSNDPAEAHELVREPASFEERVGEGRTTEEDRHPQAARGRGATEGADSAFSWNFNVTWSRRWRRHDHVNASRGCTSVPHRSPKNPSRTLVSWRGAAKRPWPKNCDELLNRSVWPDACRRRRLENHLSIGGRSAASKRGCILLLLHLYVCNGNGSSAA